MSSGVLRPSEQASGPGLFRGAADGRSVRTARMAAGRSPALPRASPAGWVSRAGRGDRTGGTDGAARTDGADRARARTGAGGAARHHTIGEAVGQSFRRRQDPVALGVAMDFLLGLAGMVR